MLAAHAGSTLLPEQENNYLATTVYQHTGWKHADGAPGFINAIAQTADGWLWLGSASGLFRFDGIKFEQITTLGGHPLKSNVISSLYAEGNTLWIGYQYGRASVFDGKSVRHFSELDGLPPGTIFGFARGPDGKMYAGGNGGIGRLDGQHWVHFWPNGGYGGMQATKMFFDLHGALWVNAYGDIQVNTPGGTRFSTVYRSPDASMSISPMGDIWIAGRSIGLLRCDPIRRQFEPVLPAGSNSGPLTVDFQHNGQMLLNRIGSVELVDSPNSMHSLARITVQNGLSGEHVLSNLLEDREGNIWVGTTGGLDRLYLSTLTQVILPPGTTQTGLTAGENGRVWVTSDHDTSLMELDPQGHFSYSGLSSITASVRAANDVVWFGSETGVWRKRGDEMQFWALPKDMTGKPIMAMAPAGNNDGVWVSITRLGLFLLQDGEWRRRAGRLDIPDLSPTSMLLDSRHRLWLGFSESRITMVDGDKVVNYESRDGLSLGNVLSLYERNGVLWAGGETGVARLSGRTFVPLRDADGHNFAGVSGIVQRANGELWLYGVDGLNRIDAAVIQQVLRAGLTEVPAERFDYRNGLVGVPAQLRPVSSLIEASDGRIWYATDDSVGWLDPAHIRRNNTMPPVLVTGLKADDVVYRDDDNVSLPRNTRNVQISFTALGLTLPQRMHFKYQLTGVDATWQDAGNRREAFYTNLAPGNYRFTVIAANEDDVWNIAGASIDFYIPPTFVQSRWFIVLMALGLLLLAGLLYLWRVRYLTARMRERIHERVQERERIARALHDTLLQGVQGLILSVNTATRYMRTDFERGEAMIEDSLNHAEQLLSQGRDQVRDLRSGSELKYELSHALKELATHLTRQYGIDIFVSCGTERRPLREGAAAEIFAIVREALVNAARHAGAQFIEVQLEYSRSFLICEVRDGGRGIPDFELLQDQREGHWGIPGMRERAQKLGGVLFIETQPGAGTQVTVAIPGHKVYLAPGWVLRAWRMLFKRRTASQSGSLPPVD
ncbi:sensor histidine kinase [Silvimonas amylolytica]|uniref:Histidine kinase n=1 Tax=Silvimonas amylolytica TaxID=449663 RepID=A0ABQ2PNC9_9NEIS|nr:two-component regulator propeller domain-containing protein [Silvimonas amylolytica]GGP26512.1 histidine kinase [Silvimonas amylolytica]